ncbi:adhesion protein, partial [Salmonella enterica subsp. enterica serovar Weltevreden]|nr:adhesion protein [Salmonella enterica subsp. enterica serovar Weltevreden]
SYGPSYYTTLNLYTMGEVVTALRKSCLGMDITVQEGTSASVKFTWKEIQSGFYGWSSSNVFGQYMDTEKTYNRSGT